MTDSTADLQRAAALSQTADPLAPGWIRARPSRQDFRNDIWVAVLLAAGTALSVTLSRMADIYADSPTWLVILWVAAIALPLAVRRRWPEITALVIAVVFSGGAMLGVTDLLFSSICLYMAIYTVGAWAPNRTRAIWVRAVIIAGMFIWLFWSLIVAANQMTAMPDLSREGLISPYAAFGLLQVLINLIYFSAAYYFGNAAWRSARQSAALEARTQELADERLRSAAQAVSLERIRIARELHDVVAHHVSLMGVQAGAARRILNRDPNQAAVALEAIERSARTAVEELHTMLGTLRSDDEPHNRGNSTRGIDQLSELAKECTLAGVPVAVTIVGEPREVPGTVGLCVYRIAQEALTNTRKHAGHGATADLRLRYEANAIELEVTDDGIGPVTGMDPTPGSGLGQRGMRERVAAVGGQIQLGAKPRGGYLVRARFPTAAAAAVAVAAEIDGGIPPALGASMLPTLPTLPTLEPTGDKS
ncbi:sensor histidine kinase [Leifsonia sp. A12D58]|uniref:sensor histidine kinase n=1 Tax=Leifsonia sp. A12D58 TaxID=3397674 RepID=UPI0039E07D3F